jgi:hypothetical protein
VRQIWVGARDLELCASLALRSNHNQH